MMRALLAKKAALNITKRMKVDQDCSFDDIKTCYSNLQPTTIGNTRVACLNTDDGYVFARPVKVTPKNGNAVEGAYMVVGGCYRIELPADFDQNSESFYVQASSSVEEKGKKQIIDYYVVTKKEADLNLKYKIEYSNVKTNENGEPTEYDVDYEDRTFYVYNPKKFSAEADVDDEFRVTTENYDMKEFKPIYLTKESKKINDIIYGIFNLESTSEEKPDWSKTDSFGVSGSATVEVKGNDLGGFPEKSWKVQSGIFTKDTPDDDLPGNGLSGGAIAGIVIACVVVVGVVVFCVVWFVVLKKPCCCGKGGKNSDAEA